MNSIHFSYPVVTEVTGITKSSLFEAASRLGIKTSRKGYTVDQIKAIQHNIEIHSRGTQRFGTADQLREALAH